MSHTVNYTSFERGMAEYSRDLHSELRGILKHSSVIYGERAARYVPPMVNGRWSKSIPASLYKRDFVAPLSSLVRTDTRNRQLFRDKLRQGYRFAVRGLLRGRAHWWFATTLRKTTQYTRIYNRGMFKFLFGANFGSIGEQTPSYFTRLLQKSPNLIHHRNEHVLELKSERETERIRIVNDAWHNDAFARESRYRGDLAARKYIAKAWKDWEKQRRMV